jgi:hypothetical protein
MFGWAAAVSGDSQRNQEPEGRAGGATPWLHRTVDQPEEARMRVQRAVTVVVFSLSVGCGRAPLRGAAIGGVAEPSLNLSDLDIDLDRSDLATQAPEEDVSTRSFWSLSAHPRVASLVRRFRRDRYQSLRSALTRGGRYIDMIAREFSREGVPPQFAFLPIIESGFDHDAVAGSTSGLWQLSRQTAESYGLVVNQEIDERNDPEKASHVAARLLRDLYDTFERWDLALAAYNAGIGTVQRARERAPEADFWKLADRGLLPDQTRRYVPEALATMAIASKPEQFGLGDIERYEPLRYETFLVQKRLDIRTVASLCSSTTDQIAELNPSLKRGVVPGKGSGFQLRIPEGSREQFAANYSAMVDSSEERSRSGGSSGGEVRKSSRGGGRYAPKRGRDLRHAALGRA